MLDTKQFADKLRHHRKQLGLTQEDVAERIGVSGQAVSKWEAAECLPDLWNLKALTVLYGISADTLLDTETTNNIVDVSAKIEQLADEFIWSKYSRDLHRDLGDDLWQMWKGIYFLETGDITRRQQEKANANLRICSEYGMKIWDDDGVVCVVQSALREKLSEIRASDLALLREIATPEGFALIAALDSNMPTPKADLVARCGVELSRLNELLIAFSEAKIIEFICDGPGVEGYKMHGRYGISGYMLLAAAFVLSKPTGMISEYINRPPRDWNASVPAARGNAFPLDDESTGIEAEIEGEKNQ